MEAERRDVERTGGEGDRAARAGGVVELPLTRPELDEDAEGADEGV